MGAPGQTCGGSAERGASCTHLLLQLESCELCFLRARAAGAGAASPAPRTLVSLPPRPCRRRCTCHRAAACALTPCRGAAARGQSHHLPGALLAQPCRAPGNAASASLPAPGSRTSSPATARAACAPQPWRRSPRCASAPCVAGGQSKGANNRQQSRGWNSGTPKKPGRGRREPRTPPEQDSAKPHFLRWPLADRQVGSSRAAARTPRALGTAAALLAPTLRKI